MSMLWGNQKHSVLLIIWALNFHASPTKKISSQRTHSKSDRRHNLGTSRSPTEKKQQEVHFCWVKSGLESERAGK